jgi:hypothetical protein
MALCNDNALMLFVLFGAFFLCKMAFLGYEIKISS